MGHLLSLGLFLTLIASALAAASAGCGTASPYVLGSNTSLSVMSASRNRTFLVYMPAGYDFNSPRPLVVLLHGGLGTGAQAESSFGFDATASANNVIALYPDGYQNTWNAGTCCGQAMTLNVDDVQFMRDMLDTIEAVLCVDMNRIYATGMSNGAFMAQRLGCQLADRIAAIAPVEGTLLFSPCSPSRPMPVFELHGTSDLNVPYSGGVGCGITGVNYTSVPYSLDVWRTANGCSAAATGSIVISDANCTTWASCSSAANVTLCLINGGGHSWSGGGSSAIFSGGCNYTVGLFSANNNIWNFFSMQSLGATLPPNTASAAPTMATSSAPTISTGATSPPNTASAAPTMATSSAPTISTGVVTHVLCIVGLLLVIAL